MTYALQTQDEESAQEACKQIAAATDTLNMNSSYPLSGVSPCLRPM